MEKTAKLYEATSEILVTKEEIAQAVRKVGAMITADYEGQEVVVVCILKGASIFYCDLIRELDLPITEDFMIVSSYGDGTNSTGNVRIRKDLDNDIAGKHVLIVEDIVDTGTTLNFLRNILKDRGAASIKIATLLDKPSRRTVDLKADYFCFTIPNAFVVGYGLDYAEKYRNLPDICVLKPEIYS